MARSKRTGLGASGGNGGSGDDSDDESNQDLGGSENERKVYIKMEEVSLAFVIILIELPALESK